MRKKSSKQLQVSCPKCQSSFATPAAVDKHFTETHPGEKKYCTMCDCKYDKYVPGPHRSRCAGTRFLFFLLQSTNQIQIYKFASGVFAVMENQRCKTRWPENRRKTLWVWPSLLRTVPVYCFPAELGSALGHERSTPHPRGNKSSGTLPLCSCFCTCRQKSDVHSIPDLWQPQQQQQQK